MTNSVATTKSTAVVVSSTSFVDTIVSKQKEEFLQLNAGLNLDYVNVGAWIHMNKKGQFCEKDTGEVLGDSLDVIIGEGQEKFTLWEKGNNKPLFDVDSEDEARSKIRVMAEESPDFPFTIDDVQTRYILSMVPVNSIGDDPKVYTLALSFTNKLSYGKWSWAMYKGAEKVKGIPSKTPVKDIVTRISVIEKKSRGGDEYLGMEFSAVELFDLAKYSK